MTAECNMRPQLDPGLGWEEEITTADIIETVGQFEYDCVLDNSIVSMLHFLNSVIGL